jgi:hypothetical protein
MRMLSWDALDPFPFQGGGAVTTSLLSLAKADLRAAAQYVCELPYGRNSNPNDPLVVLAERRGTCSTKHALIRRLAIEQEYDLALMLGIYEMTERNTPGVEAVLRRYGLSSLLEAHCYLRNKINDKCIDVTRTVSQHGRGESTKLFLHEEEIDPTQITGYKTGVHKKFLRQWMAGNDNLNRFSFEQIWAVREECIAGLNPSLGAYSSSSA